MCGSHIYISLISFEGPGQGILQPLFSAGDFRSYKSTPHKSSGEENVAEETASIERGQAAGVYSCPQDGCTRVFQRLSALEKHLSLEKNSLMDLAKIGYKSYLEEGVGKLPSLQAPVRQEDSRVSLKEGWALRVVRKAYRFSEKQKSYLLSKFRIGQTTGHKLDAEVVAREMQRARGTDGARLFQSSEFLTTTQITSFFSRQSALVRQRDPDEADIRAAQEESNVSEAKETVASIQLDHPLIYDQYDLCEMALNDSLKILKLPMLQHMCEDLGLDIPSKPMRKKAPYFALLKEIVSKCTCQKSS